MFELRKSRPNHLDIFDEAFNIADDMSNSLFNRGMLSDSILSTIKVDVKETEKEYVIEADLPGVNKENIKVDLKDNVLKITVDTEEKKEDKNENFILRERKSTNLSRSFYVDKVQKDKIKGQYEQGVLTLTIPKITVEKSSTTNIRID